MSKYPVTVARTSTSDQSALALEASPLHSHAPSRWRALIPLLLLSVYVAQGVWFIRTQSLTWDEPFHIMAGFEEWREGRFKAVADHPPLAHLLLTMATAGSDSKITLFTQPRVQRVDAITPGPEWLAMRTRPLNLALGVLLGLLLWFTARRLFSEGAANVALALYAFSAAPLAHYSMVTTDGVTTLMIFATAVQVMRWRRNSSWPRMALLGVTLGLLLLSKMHAPAFVLLAIAFILCPDLESLKLVRRWKWRPALAATAIAMLVLWGGYFFHVTHFTTQHGTVYNTFPPDPKPVPMNFSMEGNLSLWVPAGEYVSGFLQTMQRNERGQTKYAFGTSSMGLMPFLMPITILLKWPAVVLLLFGCSVYLFARRRLKLPAEWPVLVAFPALVLLLAMISRIALGERHLLPAYPFALLFASAIWEYAAGRESGEATTRWRHAPIVFVLLAICANAADVQRVAPDYLSYFTPLVPQKQSYRLLVDSNLDWGQGLLAVRDYEAHHPDEQIHLAYYGLVNPSVYGLRATPLLPHQPQTGTIVVSATHLSGLTAGGTCGFCWLKQYPLKTMLNHSLFVYEVPANADAK